ncbi:hypothetical protein ACEQ8H_006865 [Pleosporales sp. CAS-2024a]
MEDNKNSCELFEYTSGRWIYNESRRLAERRLAFNVDELLKAAANSVNRPTSDIKSFRKIGEGGFNRVIDISMKDGSSVLARLPYPSTLPRRLAVASEVATLAFVRAHGIPTPRVLGYSADDNAVGAEYILMEKLPGRPIGDAWFDLSEQERLKLLLQIVQLETKLFSIHLPASGSIYFGRDLPPNTPRIDIPGSDGGLCIGPYAGLRWWFGERGDLEIDRGPHENSRLVLQTPAEKELAWIRAYGRPRFPFERAHRETFDYRKQNPEEHAKSLENYIQVAPYLVPTSSKLNLPVLRHPDLQPNNIFVSEDLSITGLIDWQHSLVLPTFLAAGMPNSFQNYETELLKRRIFNDASSPWEGLNTPLQMDIIRVFQNWSKIAPANSDGIIPACPVMLTEQEMQRRAVLDEALRKVDSDMEQISRHLGIASDGWTANEYFESAKKRAKSIREQGLASVSDDPWLMEMTEQHWPFDDYHEDE